MPEVSPHRPARESAHDLNALAPLVTMFFLITYRMLNVVVLIEQSLGLDFVERMVDTTKVRCLLVMDSGRESALA